MTELQVVLRLEKTGYRPGELLAGAFRLDGDPPDRYMVESSVLWRTEGKGDEDLGVILFRDWTPDERPFDFSRPQEFTALLPRSPLSYDGVLVKVHWLARVRVRWSADGEAVAEESFQLSASRPVTA